MLLSTTSPMKNPIRIESATPDDIPAIQQIAQATWGPAYSTILSEAQIAFMLNWMYSAESLREQFERGGRFLMLFEGEHPVGFAGFEAVEKGGYKLHKLYVLPTKQKSGFGQKLLTAVEDVVKTEGGSFLDLNVNRNNAARFFYEKIGFFLLRTEDNYIGNGFWMNDFVMRKSLQN